MAAPISGAPSLAPTQHENHETHERYGPLSAITFVSAPTMRSRTKSFDGKDSSSSIQCQLADDHNVVCYSDLWQAPVVRQWLMDGRLYREAEERIPSRYELFFDLLLVGVVHQLADVAAESVSGASVAKVALTFYPAWSIWADLRNALNTSGVDDVAERVHTLIICVCLIGYSANAAAIEVGHHAAEGASEAAAHAVTGILRRAAEVATAAAEGVVAEYAGSYSSQTAVRSAVTFFLITKLLRILTCLHYAYALPEFRVSHAMRALGMTIVSLIFMGVIWAPTIKAVAIIAIFAIATEIAARLSIGVGVSVERRRSAHKNAKAKQLAEAQGAHDPASADLEATFNKLEHRLIPAINIEHMIERNAAFVTVVLGETVVSLLYTATTGTYGASKEYGRAIFSCIVVFIFNALYFESALSKKFVHAIRRHWATHVFWDLLHFPLCLSLILSSSAVSIMVKNQTEQRGVRGVRWQYGGSLSVALFCITASGLLHRSLDHKGASRLNWKYRAIVRSCVAVIFALLPLSTELSDLSFLCIYAGIASFLVLLELWGKLGTDVDEEEQVDHRPVEDAEDAREDAEAEQECAEEARSRKDDSSSSDSPSTSRD